MTQGSTQYLRFRVAMLFIRLSTHTVADPETGKWGGAGTGAVTVKRHRSYRYSTVHESLRALGNVDEVPPICDSRRQNSRRER